MRYAKLAILAAAGFFITSGASAMPINNLAQAVPDDQATPEQVRLVCDEWGRCWRTPSRRYYRPYWGGYYGPRYGYYGHPYRYGYGGPSVGFSFRF